MSELGLQYWMTRWGWRINYCAIEWSEFNRLIIIFSSLLSPFSSPPRTRPKSHGSHGANVPAGPQTRHIPAERQQCKWVLAKRRRQWRWQYNRERDTDKQWQPRQSNGRLQPDLTADRRTGEQQQSEWLNDVAGIAQLQQTVPVPAQSSAERVQAPVLDMRGQGEWQALRRVQLWGVQGLLQADGAQGPDVRMQRGEELYNWQAAAEPVPVL